MHGLLALCFGTESGAWRAGHPLPPRTAQLGQHTRHPGISGEGGETGYSPGECCGLLPEAAPKQGERPGEVKNYPRLSSLGRLAAPGCWLLVDTGDQGSGIT